MVLQNKLLDILQSGVKRLYSFTNGFMTDCQGINNHEFF